MSHVTGHLSRVTSHVSNVTWHLSSITGHLSLTPTAHGTDPPLDTSPTIQRKVGLQTPKNYFFNAKSPLVHQEASFQRYDKHTNIKTYIHKTDIQYNLQTESAQGSSSENISGLCSSWALTSAHELVRAWLKIRVQVQVCVIVLQKTEKLNLLLITGPFILPNLRLIRAENEHQTRGTPKLQANRRVTTPGSISSVIMKVSYNPSSRARLSQ